jgi:hypothetical protein
VCEASQTAQLIEAAGCDSPVITARDLKILQRIFRWLLLLLLLGAYCWRQRHIFVLLLLVIPYNKISPQTQSRQ